MPNRRSLIYSTILIWLCLTSTAPFIFYTWPFHPYKILTLFCLLAMSYEMLKEQILKINRNYLFIVFQLSFFYILLIFYHEDKSYINYIIQLCAFIIISTYIYKTIGFSFFVKSYIYVIMIMGCGGTFIFILHLIIGVPPLFSVDYSDSGTSYFLWLTTTNVYYNLDSGARFIRYSGFFDEPGQYALFSIFAIILNRVYNYNSRYDKILIITGVFVFSTAFYAFLILYFVLFYFNRANLKISLGIIFLLTLAVTYIQYSKDERVTLLRTQTIERFSFDESTGKFNADNRSDRVENDKRVFFKYPMLGSGNIKEHIMHSNYCSVLAQFGLIGAMFHYSFYLFYILCILRSVSGRNDLLFYGKIILLIFINIFHRPDFSPAIISLIFCSLINEVNTNKKLKCKYICVKKESADL